MSLSTLQRPTPLVRNTRRGTRARLTVALIAIGLAGTATLGIHSQQPDYGPLIVHGVVSR